MHTPGPWYINQTNDFMREGPSTTIIADDPIVPIALILNEYQTSRAADARLIAAAPELLAACQLLMNAKDVQFGSRDGAVMGAVSTAIDAARAAIAKATA